MYVYIYIILFFLTIIFFINNYFYKQWFNIFIGIYIQIPYLSIYL